MQVNFYRIFIVVLFIQFKLLILEVIGKIRYNLNDIVY